MNLGALEGGLKFHGFSVLFGGLELRRVRWPRMQNVKKAHSRKQKYRIEGGRRPPSQPGTQGPAALISGATNDYTVQYHMLRITISYLHDMLRIINSY